MNSLVLFDMVGTVVILIFAYRGFRKGALNELKKIIGIIASFMLALWYYPDLTQVLHPWLLWENNLEELISFITLFVISAGIISYLMKFFQWGMKKLKIGFVDKLLGFLFGGLKAVFIISAFLPVIRVLPPSIPVVTEIREHSLFYRHLQGVTPAVYAKLRAQMSKPGRASELFGGLMQKATPLVPEKELQKLKSLLDSGKERTQALQKRLNQGEPSKDF
ncbi:CvpA family protein [Deltaproteobacteria bacterium TL4]